LIACSNIAGLMLARASGRSREIAVRTALGAGRWDLIRQSLAESLILAFAAALVGLGVAFADLKGLLALAPDGLPVAVGVSMDATVLGFTVLAALVAGILFGVAPAWQISRFDSYELLKEGGRANTGGLGRQHLRSALVVGEVALALVLLVGAGLFLRSLAALEDVNPGFQPGGVITASLSLPPAQYAGRASRAAFYRAVLGNLSAMPGVTAVAAGTPVPFSGDGGSASLPSKAGPRPQAIPARTAMSLTSARISSQPCAFLSARGACLPMGTGRIPRPSPSSMKSSPANTGQTKIPLESTSAAAGRRGPLLSASWPTSRMRISVAKM
jgi:hypothetical protein